jgi:hypothetical protein
MVYIPLQKLYLLKLGACSSECQREQESANREGYGGSSVITRVW